jgi:hypothetical protein
MASWFITTTRSHWQCRVRIKEHSNASNVRRAFLEYLQPLASERELKSGEPSDIADWLR